jgi:hypothetical protein
MPQSKDVLTFVTLVVKVLASINYSIMLTEMFLFRSAPVMF